MSYRFPGFLIKTFVLPLVVLLMVSSNGASRSRQWLDRPWEIRYLLFVDNADMQRLHVVNARSRNFRVGRDAPIYLDSGELFLPQLIYKAGYRDSLSKVFIQFDRSGVVLTENSRHRALIGKRNLLDDVVLQEPESADLRPYDLAKWSEGIPGDTTFSPAVCAYVDEDRYLSNWDKASLAGNFGCREWTAQMREREQPYIDVTTYRPGHNFIGEFVGWATFNDPPIPVIGMQGKVWLCLHDCPDGEAPGVIHNFKAWLKKHHYPMPERPPKQPLYPNADYWDDIHEMDDD